MPLHRTMYRAEARGRAVQPMSIRVTQAGDCSTAQPQSPALWWLSTGKHPASWREDRKREQGADALHLAAHRRPHRKDWAKGAALLSAFLHNILYSYNTST